MVSRLFFIRYIRYNQRACNFIIRLIAPSTNLTQNNNIFKFIFMEYFSPLARAINVSFECVECNSAINETIDELPIANMVADNVADSENSDEEVISCYACGKEYICSICVNQYEGNIEIGTDEGEIVENITIESIMDED